MRIPCVNSAKILKKSLERALTAVHRGAGPNRAATAGAARTGRRSRGRGPFGPTGRGPRPPRSWSCRRRSGACPGLRPRGPWRPGQAACSAVRPAKNRSLTGSALGGSAAPSCRRAASRASKRSPFSSTRTGLDVVEIEPAASASGLLGLLVPGRVDQDTAHGLGGGGEEVPAAVPVLGLLLAHQPQVRLMHQRGRLQGLTRLFLCQPLRRQLRSSS